MSNLAVEPAGAFMAARDIIAEEINSHIKQYRRRGLAGNFQSVVESMRTGFGTLFLLQNNRQAI